MVINKNGTVEQVTHYYPYGGLIGDISTLLSDVTKGNLLSDVTKGNNENVQKYKFEGPRSHQKEIDNLLARRRALRRGVELDRTFGLDNYDIQARQYFAMMPSWDRIDPLAEKYYGISSYAFCGGDPVNFGDYDGESIYMVTKSGDIQMLLLTDDEYDDLIGYDGNDNLQYIQTTDQSTITSLYKSKTNGKANKDNYALSESPEAKKLFEFFADVTDNEWSLEVFNNNGKTQYLLGTSNNERQSGKYYFRNDMKEIGIKEEDMIWKVHSHSQIWGEGGMPGGSGYDDIKPYGDEKHWIDLNNKFRNIYKRSTPNTYVYHRKSKTYFKYNGNNGRIPISGGINFLK